MDDLTYHYLTGTNQLTYVDDAIGDGVNGNDIDDQASGNYEYDAIGNSNAVRFSSRTQPSGLTAQYGQYIFNTTRIWSR